VLRVIGKGQHEALQGANSFQNCMEREKELCKCSKRAVMPDVALPLYRRFGESTTEGEIMTRRVTGTGLTSMSRRL